MPVIRLTDLSDPRLALYRNIKDRELATQGDLFMAEGLLVVQRLLRSAYPCLSVLCAERKLDALLPDAGPDIPVYVVPDALLHEVVGFKFHTGVLGVGRRLPRTPLEGVLPKREGMTLVVLPHTNNLENVGSIARISAAFGVDAMILGEGCCDPFYRHALRVSMGTIFALPLYRSEDLKRDLVTLRDGYGVQLAATVLDPAAEPLAGASRPGRVALLFGAEADGLPGDYLEICSRRVTIPMSLGTDSLNVSMAAAVFLYHFTQLARA